MRDWFFCNAFAINRAPSSPIFPPITRKTRGKRRRSGKPSMRQMKEKDRSKESGTTSKVEGADSSGLSDDRSKGRGTARSNFITYYHTNHSTKRMKE